MSISAYYLVGIIKALDLGHLGRLIGFENACRFAATVFIAVGIFTVAAITSYLWLTILYSLSPGSMTFHRCSSPSIKYSLLFTLCLTFTPVSMS
jgi:hypothetical protein